MSFELKNRIALAGRPDEALLDSLFKRASGQKRHLETPLLQEREHYLAHMLEEGATPSRVKHIAYLLIQVVDFLNLDSLETVTRPQISEAANAWAKKTFATRTRKSTVASPTPFRRVAAGWLSFCGALAVPRVELPFQPILDSFTEHMRITKSATSETILTHKRRLNAFLKWLDRRDTEVLGATLDEVVLYVRYRSDDLKPRSVAALCQTLRTFFRYTASRGWTQRGIADGITSPTYLRYDPKPQGPRWTDVKRLLRFGSSKSRADWRARAMLQLCAIYAMRSSEISSLLLADFNWIDESLTIHRAKRGRTQVFPLRFDVGEAILEYIHRVRPVCATRNLFVTLNPPYRALPASSIYTLIASRMKALRIESAHKGPHALRHSCATQLLDKGYSLNEIADYLGHRTNRTVGIYAKSSVAAIREVAAFSLRAVL